MKHTTANTERYGLIPAPLSMTERPGVCTFAAGTSIRADEPFSHEADIASKQLTLAGLSCTSGSKEQAAPGLPEITLRQTLAEADKESYTLEISPEGVLITASDRAGAFYGLQTLRQLVMTNGSSLPCLYIEDKPAYTWRGFMIDTCRTFFRTEFLKRMIDAAALHKLNIFHWHLTDDQGWRLPVPEWPLLTEKGSKRKDRRYSWGKEVGGFYTEDEIRDVVSYAAERHITVVPEIETPGHTVSVLAAYPRFGCTGGPYEVEDRFGIFKDVLCAGEDEIFTLLDNVFATVARLFPGPYIHIGGDECPRDRWRECPRCAARIQKEGLSGPEELQSWLTVQIAKLVEKHGKTPIGWDEVLDGTERLGLPKSLIVQSWRGTEGGIKAGTLGHRVIMSPLTNGCYLDYKQLDSADEPGVHIVITGRDSYAYSPVPQGYPEDKRDNVLGGQGNLWTELIYAAKIAEYMLFPRLCALSESLWLPEGKKDFDSYSSRLSVHKQRLESLGILYYKGPLS